MEATFSLSPISQHCVTSSSFNSTFAEKASKSESEPSSVVFGPSGDHELGFHQGVKSQLFQSTDLRSEDNSEDEKNKFSTTSLPNSKALPRRVLFPNGQINGISSLDDPPVSLPTTNDSKNVRHAELPSTSEAKSTDSDVSDHDAFWQKQLKSLQLAAGNTRELFQIGLNDPEEVLDANAATDDKRFVEDIEAASEELGSLVLHDLEDIDSKKTVIKETREAIGPDAGVNAKLAFENRTSTNSETEEHHSGGNSVQNTEVDHEDKMWDVNNSIEIRKFKDDGQSSKHEPGAELRDIDDEAIAKEFVPSKWNQSLVPSRPAIKSPEQQPKSYMKKSVSFEMNKTQLVYEYPPPPVEEEEKTITPLASASLPMSSSLDWELTQEELEDAEINHEDWDDDVLPKPGDPMDVYRISGFSDDNFQVRGSNEPFEFSPSTLGELRHTRDRLRLDLNRGEANFLDDEANKSNPTKLDSGVGSSTNVSPFNNCDILTKRSKNSE
ncbi:hypothetical protein Ocin01_00577 [Orchesella cincta]|uniref:Uncharacterized protein n=1 Tax=Orchesella cincta TaxID=48709 RepID=A0A1D2NLX3_ORCCI|nr:hypothetical protein Ocin01_00577 [Orchesella cincta]